METSWRHNPYLSEKQIDYFGDDMLWWVTLIGKERFVLFEMRKSKDEVR